MTLFPAEFVRLEPNAAHVLVPSAAVEISACPAPHVVGTMLRLTVDPLEDRPVPAALRNVPHALVPFAAVEISAWPAWLAGSLPRRCAPAAHSQLAASREV
jgi:hypothetical protein